MKKFAFTLISVLMLNIFAFQSNAQLKEKQMYEYTFAVDTLKAADNATFMLPVMIDGSYDYCYTIECDSVNNSEPVTIRLYEYSGTYWGKARYLKLTSTNDTTIVGQCYGLKQKLYFSQSADTTAIKVGVTLKKRFR